MRKSQIPAPSAEVRRLKAAALIVMAVSLSLIAIPIRFGDMPRPVVDRLNLVLLPTMIVLLGVISYVLYRYRRVCTRQQHEHYD